MAEQGVSGSGQLRPEAGGSPRAASLAGRALPSVSWEVGGVCPAFVLRHPIIRNCIFVGEPSGHLSAAGVLNVHVLKWFCFGEK